MGYGGNPYGILEVSDDCVKFSDRGVSRIFATCVPARKRVLLP